MYTELPKECFGDLYGIVCEVVRLCSVPYSPIVKECVPHNLAVTRAVGNNLLILEYLLMMIMLHRFALVSSGNAWKICIAYNHSIFDTGSSRTCRLRFKNALSLVQLYQPLSVWRKSSTTFER